MKSVAVRLILVSLLVSVLPVYATQGTERDATCLCQRELHVPGRTDVGFLDYVFGMLGTADVPFGIVDARSVAPEPRFVFPEADGTLGKVLDSAVRIDQRFSWRERDGVIEVFRVGFDPPILNCMLQQLDLTEAIAPSAIGSVEQMPEVRACAQRLGLRNGMHAGSWLTSSQPPHVSLQLRGVTVRDALNAIVRAFGRGRWIYREYTENGVTSFTLD